MKILLLLLALISQIAFGYTERDVLRPILKDPLYNLSKKSYKGNFIKLDKDTYYDESIHMTTKRFETRDLADIYFEEQLKTLKGETFTVELENIYIMVFGDLGHTTLLSIYYANSNTTWVTKVTNLHELSHFTDVITALYHLDSESNFKHYRLK